MCYNLLPQLWSVCTTQYTIAQSRKLTVKTYSAVKMVQKLNRFEKRKLIVCHHHHASVFTFSH